MLKPEAFEGKTVVITGASGGIGGALSEAFVALGSNVVGLDKHPGDTQARAVDITQPDQVADAISELDQIDVLIHAAGITSLGPLAETPLDAIDKVIDVNLRGAIVVTKLALPALTVAQGRIGVLSSVSGFSPLVYRTAYSASKYALHGFFESLRTELVADGVTVTMICPSFVATGIENRAAHRSANDAGGWTTTGEVIESAQLATQIVTALASRKRLLLPSRTARLAWTVSRFLPSRYETLMRRRIQS